jgi:histidinol-phosphatase
MRTEGAGTGGEFVGELSFGLELAAESDEIAMHWFSRDPDVSTKQDGTLVTVADREIERMLRRRIHDRFPDDGILGEEGGLELGQPGESGRLWILDPIDGTNNYTWGIPIFGTLIGLRVGGRTVVGVVSAPALGERYDAALGSGARMNGSPIGVSSVSTVDDARICFASWGGWASAGLADRWASILTRCRRSRGFGDFWGHMLVARGAADAMAEPELRIWDVAAMEIVVEEAGGRLTTLSGERWGRVPTAELYDLRQSCLTTNGSIHGAILSELSGG